MPEEHVSANTAEQQADPNGAKAAEIATGSQKDTSPTPPRRFSLLLELAAIAGAVLVASVVVLAGLVGYFHFALPVASVGPPSPGSPRPSVEWLFQQSIPDTSSTSDRMDEWRAARSDHKIIAYSIARCLKSDIETMSPGTFSLLMLDLRPNGDHLQHWAADMPGPDQRPLQISGYQGAILALSDAISRGRIAAAAAGGGFYPYMFWFGWVSVGVSALATMVVTLRSSMGSAARGLMFVGILAIFFSTVATVLTGAKQFWDPTNAYMRNEGALLALKQLHQDMALTFAATWSEWCQSDEAASAQSTRLARWRGTLVSLQAGTMTAPVIVQNPAAQAGNGEADEVGRRGPPARPLAVNETSSTPDQQIRTNAKK